MTQQLAAIFGELGISQYLDAFVDQGFDSWETILLVTEADLDALNVKLGHRRKLQRRIANSRGIPPEALAAAPSPARPGNEEQRNGLPALQPRPPKADSREVHVTKRKYRRHPRPDENAPERPPSAYVLFSNRVREELKGRNLTFTEIAKLVGERWQNLSPAEKETYESQAQFAKEQYNNDMAEYKKTPDYRKYMVYLQEFKAKHAHQAADKDASKRLKVSESGRASASSSNPTPNRGSRSGSSSESALGSNDPPPPSGRKQRLGAALSALDSQSAAVQTSQPMSIDEPHAFSPTSVSLDPREERSPSFGTIASPHDMPAGLPSRRSSVWSDDQQMPAQLKLLPPSLPAPQPHEQPLPPQSQSRSLPRLCDIVDSHRLMNGGPPPRLPSETSSGSGFPFPLRNPQSGSPRSVSSLRGSASGPPSGPPSLRHETSSAGSTSSNSSSFPRSPVEAAVPIQALLSGPKAGFGPSEPPFLPPYRASPAPLDESMQSPSQPFLPYPSGSSVSMPILNGYGFHPPSLPAPATGPGGGYGGYANGVPAAGVAAQLSSLPNPALPPPPPPPQQQQQQQQQQQLPGGDRAKQDLAGLDGLGALLRAGEIVDRRTSR